MKEKRDMSVELARILACLIVIGVHSCLNVYHDDYFDLNRIFISCLLADGVAVFWLIMGSFLFRTSNYKGLFQKTVKTVGIPMVCIILFTFYFSGWLINGLSLLQSVARTKDDYINLFHSFFAWETPGGYVGHLWYLYTYFMVIFCFPILKSFADYLDLKAERIQRFLILSFLFLVINDISNNRLAAFSHHSINALIPASIEILWGHILYKHKAIFVKKRMILLSFVTFVVLNILRTIVQFRYYNLDKGNHILYWYTGIGLICAISLIIFCFSIVNSAKKSIVKWIGIIASYTFNIYLIHPFVIAKLQKYSFQDKLYTNIIIFDKTYRGELFYMVCIITIIFLLSLCVSALLQGIINSIARGEKN